jgi:hypothetical protein
MQLNRKGEEEDLNAKATVIQAAFRGYKARKNLSKEHNVSEDILNEKATKIQAVYRGYRARKALKASLEFEEVEHMIEFEDKYMKIMKQIRREQKALRDQNLQTVKEVKSEIRKCEELLAKFRAETGEDGVKEMPSDVRRCEENMDMYRATVATAEKALNDYYANIWKSGWRSHRVRKNLEQMEKAAVTIQSNFRGFITRRKYQNFLDLTAISNEEDEHPSDLLLSKTEHAVRKIHLQVRGRLPNDGGSETMGDPENYEQ